MAPMKCDWFLIDEAQILIFKNNKSQSIMTQFEQLTS